MNEKDDVLENIVDGLLQKQTMAEILEETYRLQAAQPSYRRIIDVLQIM